MKLIIIIISISLIIATMFFFVGYSQKPPKPKTTQTPTQDCIVTESVTTWQQPDGTKITEYKCQTNNTINQI